jgi:hydroxymethylbilane synthase
MPTSALTIASRGSQLALWQARWVEAQLTALGHECRIEIIKTTGDRISAPPLSQIGSKGLFTKEIEEALLDGRADVAVHSLKDLPTELPPGLTLAAIPPREDARDAVVGARLADLAAGDIVGTSSLRRAAQLRRLCSGASIESIRGNVDTRLRKLDDGQYRAIVLAAAGLNRLGLGGRITEVLSPREMCPAVGQGALAIETRVDGAGLNACRALDHAPTRAAINAERAVLAALGGGCSVPLGAYAVVTGDRLRLIAAVVSPDGAELVNAESEGLAAEAEQIGSALAAMLLERGARRILEAVAGS